MTNKVLETAARIIASGVLIAGCIQIAAWLSDAYDMYMDDDEDNYVG